jgi:hypothetical protein
MSAGTTLLTPLPSYCPQYCCCSSYLSSSFYFSIVLWTCFGPWPPYCWSCKTVFLRHEDVSLMPNPQYRGPRCLSAWPLIQNLSNIGGPTSSYAATSIVFKYTAASYATKHAFDKLEVPSSQSCYFYKLSAQS